MLKSCPYCHRIHDSRLDCEFKKRNRYERDEEKERFRSSSLWKKKREEIKERDHYLCQICLRNLYDTRKILNSEQLSVHHAIKLENNFEKRLENENLLTVCERHHKMCDSGEIPLEAVIAIITEQTTPQG